MSLDPSIRHKVPAFESTSSPVVVVREFVKSYGGKAAVKGVSFTLQQGEVYGLIGPDAAGKSSLMKAIAGVLSYDGGSVDVFGVRIDSERSAERVKGRIGFMPQGLGQNLYGDLSVDENIDFFARVRLVSPGDLALRKKRLLEMTRLDPFRSRPMKQLSGGMKQKLGLICTLIHEPDLIVLDEPTTGVDPVSRRDFWAILGELLHERGITALISTAYLDEASRFHRLSVLFEGHSIADGKPSEVVALVPGSIVAVQTTQQPKVLELLKAHFNQVDAYGTWIKVFVENPDPHLARLEVEKVLADITPQQWQTSEPLLEDVFIALMRKRETAGSGLRFDPASHPVPEQSGVLEGNSPERRKSEPAAILAHALVREFGEFRAVDQVSFKVLPGEIFGLLGANGAGKTTVIKMLTGILPPTGGEGQVAGADMRSAGQAIKERIGYMSQAFSLYLDLTVLENIRLYAGIYGLEREERSKRAEWVLGMADLVGHESELAGSLPMGLRQRLALGCALVHRPRILFLDEPTSGVDPVGRRRFWEILFRLSREDGVAILVTTHYMGEAEHCDHLALMFAGRIVADASPAQMKADVELEAGATYEITAEPAPLALQTLITHGYPQAALFGKRIRLFCPHVDEDHRRIAGLFSQFGVALGEISARPMTMEDVFVYRVTTLEARGAQSIPPRGQDSSP